MRIFIHRAPTPGITETPEHQYVGYISLCNISDSSHISSYTKSPSFLFKKSPPFIYKTSPCSLLQETSIFPLLNKKVHISPVRKYHVYVDKKIHLSCNMKVHQITREILHKNVLVLENTETQSLSLAGVLRSRPDLRRSGNTSGTTGGECFSGRRSLNESGA